MMGKRCHKDRSEVKKEKGTIYHKNALSENRCEDIRQQPRADE